MTSHVRVVAANLAGSSLTREPRKIFAEHQGLLNLSTCLADSDRDIVLDLPLSLEQELQFSKLFGVKIRAHVNVGAERLEAVRIGPNAAAETNPLDIRPQDVTSHLACQVGEQLLELHRPTAPHLEIGADLKSPAPEGMTHGCCLLDDRTAHRYSLAVSRVGPTAAPAEDGTPVTDRGVPRFDHCLRGAMHCDVQANVLYMRNVLDLSSTDFCRIMHRKGANIAIVCMPLPNELLNDVTIEDYALGVEWVRSTKGRPTYSMVHTEGGANGYQHHVDVLKSWFHKTHTINGASFMIELVKEYHVYKVFRITRGSESVRTSGVQSVIPASVPHQTKNFTLVPHTETMIHLADELVRARGFSCCTNSLSDDQRHKMRIGLRYAMVPNEFYTTCMQHLESRSSDGIVLSNWRSYVVVKARKVTVGDATLNTGFDLGPTALATICGAMYYEALMTRRESTKGVSRFVAQFDGVPKLEQFAAFSESAAQLLDLTVRDVRRVDTVFYTLQPTTNKIVARELDKTTRYLDAEDPMELAADLFAVGAEEPDMTVAAIDLVFRYDHLGGSISPPGGLDHLGRPFFVLARDTYSQPRQDGMLADECYLVKPTDVRAKAKKFYELFGPQRLVHLTAGSPGGDLRVHAKHSDQIHYYVSDAESGLRDIRAARTRTKSYYDVVIRAARFVFGDRDTVAQCPNLVAHDCALERDGVHYVDVGFAVQQGLVTNQLVVLQNLLRNEVKFAMKLQEFVPEYCRGNDQCREVLLLPVVFYKVRPHDSELWCTNLPVPSEQQWRPRAAVKASKPPVVSQLTRALLNGALKPQLTESEKPRVVRPTAAPPAPPCDITVQKAPANAQTSAGCQAAVNTVSIGTQTDDLGHPEERVDPSVEAHIARLELAEIAYADSDDIVPYDDDCAFSGRVLTTEAIEQWFEMLFGRPSCSAALYEDDDWSDISTSDDENDTEVVPEPPKPLFDLARIEQLFQPPVAAAEPAAPPAPTPAAPPTPVPAAPPVVASLDFSALNFARAPAPAAPIPAAPTQPVVVDYAALVLGPQVAATTSVGRAPSPPPVAETPRLPTPPPPAESVRSERAETPLQPVAPIADIAAPVVRSAATPSPPPEESPFKRKRSGQRRSRRSGRKSRRVPSLPVRKPKFTVVHYPGSVLDDLQEVPLVIPMSCNMDARNGFAATAASIYPAIRHHARMELGGVCRFEHADSHAVALAVKPQSNSPAELTALASALKLVAEGCADGDQLRMPLLCCDRDGLDWYRDVWPALCNAFDGTAVTLHVYHDARPIYHNAIPREQIDTEIATAPEPPPYYQYAVHNPHYTGEMYNHAILKRPGVNVVLVGAKRHLAQSLAGCEVVEVDPATKLTMSPDSGVHSFHRNAIKLIVCGISRTAKGDIDKVVQAELPRIARTAHAEGCREIRFLNPPTPEVFRYDLNTAVTENECIAYEVQLCDTGAAKRRPVLADHDTAIVQVMDSNGRELEPPSTGLYTICEAPLEEMRPTRVPADGLCVIHSVSVHLGKNLTLDQLLTLAPRLPVRERQEYTTKLRSGHHDMTLLSQLCAIHRHSAVVSYAGRWYSSGGGQPAWHFVLRNAHLQPLHAKTQWEEQVEAADGTFSMTKQLRRRIQRDTGFPAPLQGRLSWHHHGVGADGLYYCIVNHLLARHADLGWPEDITEDEMLDKLGEEYRMRVVVNGLARHAGSEGTIDLQQSEEGWSVYAYATPDLALPLATDGRKGRVHFCAKHDLQVLKSDHVTYDRSPVCFHTTKRQMRAALLNASSVAFDTRDPMFRDTHGAAQTILADALTTIATDKHFGLDESFCIAANSPCGMTKWHATANLTAWFGVAASGKTRGLYTLKDKKDYQVLVPTRALRSEYMVKVDLEDKGALPYDSSFRHVKTVAGGLVDAVNYGRRKLVLDEVFATHPAVLFAAVTLDKVNDVVLTGDPKQGKFYGDENRAAKEFDWSQMLVINENAYNTTSLCAFAAACAIMSNDDPALARVRNLNPMRTCYGSEAHPEVVLHSSQLTNRKFDDCYVALDKQCGAVAPYGQAFTLRACQGRRPEKALLLLPENSRGLLQTVREFYYVGLTRPTTELVVYTTAKFSRELGLAPTCTCDFKSMRAGGLQQGVLDVIRDSEELRRLRVNPSRPFEVDGYRFEFTQVSFGCHDREEHKVECIQNTTEHARSLVVNFHPETAALMEVLGVPLCDVEVDPEVHHYREPESMPRLVYRPGAYVDSYLNSLMDDVAPVFNDEWGEQDHNIVTQIAPHGTLTTITVTPSKTGYHEAFENRVTPVLKMPGPFRSDAHMNSCINQVVNCAAQRFGSALHDLSFVENDVLSGHEALLDLMFPDIVAIREEMYALCLAEAAARAANKGSVHTALDETNPRDSLLISYTLKTQSKANTKVDGVIRIGDNGLKAGQPVSAQTGAVGILAGFVVRAAEKIVVRALAKLNVHFCTGMTVSELIEVSSQIGAAREKNDLCVSADFTQFDAAHQPLTRKIMEELMDRIGAPRALYGLMDKYNAEWVASGRQVSATAREMLQSGRMDTLFKNTYVCIVFHLSCLKPKTIVGVLAQGDDFMGVFDHIEPYHESLQGFVKCDFADVSACIGYTFGLQLCLDVYSMAAKLLNRNFYHPKVADRELAIEQYQTSMRDRIAPFVGDEATRQLTCWQAAVRYGTTAEHAEAVLDCLLRAAQCSVAEFTRGLTRGTAFTRVLERQE